MSRRAAKSSRRNFLADESDENDEEPMGEDQEEDQEEEEGNEDSSEADESDESDEESETEEQQPSTSRGKKRSQRSSSQRQGQIPKSASKPKSSQNLHLSFTEDDEKKFVADLTFFILVQEQKRMPLKKAEAFKATNLTGKNRDFQEQVWIKVTKKLKQTFGVDLKEAKDKKGTFFLLNTIRESFNEVNHFINLPEKECGHLGLLFVVLSLIFMSNGVVVDEDLFNFLRKMGVYDGKRVLGGARGAKVANGPDGGGGVAKDVRELFGDVHNLLFNEWSKKQQYLEITKLNTGETDNPRHEIRWGPRADLEVKKSDILKTVCQLYKVDPKSFKNEYDKVLKEEGEEVLASGEMEDEAEEQE